MPRVWPSTRGSPKRRAMQFLKTLFWVLIAVVVALFASRNWSDVTLNLWGDIQADIKLPVLLLIVFLLGFLPTWLIMRARIWSHRRRIEAMERNRVDPRSRGAGRRADGEPVDMKPDLRRHRYARPRRARRDRRRAFAAIAGGVKLGLEFFCANGPEGVAPIAELGLPIFLDLKLHDIPNTVAKAVQALAPLGPAVLTVHAAGGRDMMSAAKAAAPPARKVVAVTVLTSLDAATRRSRRRAIAGRAGRAPRRIAREPALDGIVCSGAEVAAAQGAWPDGFFVVPGVRPPGARRRRPEARRHAGQALDDGASMLVIGRPITDAADPRAAIMDIAARLSQMPPNARI